MSSRGAVAHVMLDVGVRSETFVTNAIEAVQAEGWESHVIGLRACGPLAAVPPDRIHCTGTGTLAERALTRLTKQTPERRFADQAHAYAREHNIGLLHAHFGWAGNYAAPLAELLEVPLVVTFYGTDAAEPASPYEDLFDRLHRVVAVSDYVKQHLRGLGYDGAIDVIRNGLPLERLKVRTAPPAAEDGLRLLYVGRLVPFKGAEVLLRAMPAILATHPTAHLDIIGEGSERRAFEAIAAELRLEDAVSFHGACDHAAVLEALRAAHVLIVPGKTMSTGQAETSSMVFKEALALGVPVAATASGALPETCPPEFRDRLATPGDPGALGRAVLDVLDDPAGWQRRAEIGRRWVAEHYDLDELGGRLSRCYEQALTARRPVPVG
jgi:colanic acid/amylovoran biosynthesis glycosyltransferase